MVTWAVPGSADTAAMVRRYAHLAPAQIARHAAVANGMLAGAHAGASRSGGCQQRTGGRRRDKPELHQNVNIQSE